jgi:hypothetical protein
LDKPQLRIDAEIVNSSAVTTEPSGAVRSKVWVASNTTRTACPRSLPTRAVVSQQWLPVMPQIAMLSSF